ncbi:MAG: AAA family ATPase, partial [Planctomycetota bacterium]
NVPPQGGRKHPEQQYIQMDTSQILFICGGSFVGLDEIIQRRLGKSRIGFKLHDADSGPEEITSGEALAQVTPDDVLEFGMIPELIGRLPVIAPLMPLDEEAMVSILTEPRNALIKQYQHLFSLEGGQLEFTEAALSAIAHKALARKTGARALRAVMEELMLELLYELPDVSEEGARFVIDGPDVETPKQLSDLRISQRESA